ncbi:iron-containing alcohol dehydrogenase [Paraoerskovia marina]|uniref:iron-containing alcohol dehydrogenase n=1 Tax=Paraoerskovia marina TaxID=545619 RepID=UPI001E284422|nr:iron-containing alcohol dehydrogenase [Paraoerskovia marina]
MHAGTSALKEAGADVLVAFGGASQLDTPEAVGAVVTNRAFANVRSLDGASAPSRPSVSIVAVPATAGAASEMTTNYFTTGVGRQQESLCAGPHANPMLVIVDPEMMATESREPAVATVSTRFRTPFRILSPTVGGSFQNCST